MKNFLRLTIFYIGYITSYVFSPRFLTRLNNIRNYFYTGWLKRFFSEFGKGVIIVRPIYLSGANNIKIGNRTVISGNCTISCVNRKGAELTIGNNCTVGSYNHITASNAIIIGDGVLTGPYVLITDNSHGQNRTIEENEPAKRMVYSKGKIVIGNNVWIGEKASVLPNVTIGEGAIIGANAVVTKNIPPFSIAVGNPAYVIYSMESK